MHYVLTFCYKVYDSLSLLILNGTAVNCLIAYAFASALNDILRVHAGCDLPEDWGGSTRPFVLFDPVLVHYKELFHECIHMLDTLPFWGTNRTLSTGLLYTCI